MHLGTDISELGECPWFFFGNHTDEKEHKIFLTCKEIKRDRVQSHLWLTASSYMGKNFIISSYSRSPSLYMTLHPIPSEFPYTVYEENLVFFSKIWVCMVHVKLDTSCARVSLTFISSEVPISNLDGV